MIVLTKILLRCIVDSAASAFCGVQQGSQSMDSKASNESDRMSNLRLMADECLSVPLISYSVEVSKEVSCTELVSGKRIESLSFYLVHCVEFGVECGCLRRIFII